MKSILVVDDEVEIAEVLASVLSDAGYHVVPAANGKQALARLEEVKPHLIMTDYMMPVLGGEALIAMLKAHPQHRDIPVVVMTSVPERTIAEQSKGYAGFLRKPFRIRDMLAVIEQLIGPAAQPT
jgi:two-component system, chemotaxis family, chemotaxis protein CheY